MENKIVCNEVRPSHLWWWPLFLEVHQFLSVSGMILAFPPASLRVIWWMFVESDLRCDFDFSEEELRKASSSLSFPRFVVNQWQDRSLDDWRQGRMQWMTKAFCVPSLAQCGPHRSAAIRLHCPLYQKVSFAQLAESRLYMQGGSPCLQPLQTIRLNVLWKLPLLSMLQ